jgi:hypothetical protein
VPDDIEFVLAGVVLYAAGGFDGVVADWGTGGRG